jgi:hypothetical protein
LQSFDKSNGIAPISPTNSPPEADAINPRLLTPPLVPLGTFLNVVIKTGWFFDKIPISEAHVSPVLRVNIQPTYQQAKCAKYPENSTQ